jgi:hypothetical protein
MNTKECFIISTVADIAYFDILITTLGLCGILGHCRQPEQCPWTCRIPGVFSGWDKGDIPPVIFQKKGYPNTWVVTTHKFKKCFEGMSIVHWPIHYIFQIDHFPINLLK